MEWLDPHHLSARKLDWQIRAFTPWPGSRVKLSNGETLKILEAEVSSEPISPPVGSLSGLYGKKLTLGSSNGTALVLLKVQQDGKKPVSGEDFARTLNGQTLNVVAPSF
jgi:methionyl-tRNA formyltransferase